MTNPVKLLFKNVVSNWAAMFVAIVIAFFMSPFLVHSLGKEQYGIWALVLSIIAYGHFLDAGMSQSLARFIPKYYATRDFRKLNEVLSSANAIYALTGSLVVIATLAIAFFFMGIFNVAPDLVHSMRMTLILVGINEALRFYFLTSSALGPFHRYDIGNAVDILSSIINALIIVYFIGRGYGLITLAAITLLVSLAKYIVRTVFQRRIVPETEYKFSFVNKQTIKELLGYGIISFFIVVTWMVIFNSDNIVIGAFLSTTDVTYFSIAGMMINYLRTLISSIGVPLTPTISHFDASGDYGEIGKLYKKLSRYLYYLTACIAVGILFFGGKFITLWMGEGFGSTIKVLYILIIPSAIYLPQVAANAVLLGISRHRTLLYILVVEAVANITLSIILVKPLGIYGVAWGTAIPQYIIYLFVYPYTFNRILKVGLKSIYVSSLNMIIVALFLTVPVSFLLRHFNSLIGWPGLIVDILIFAVFMVGGFWFKVLESQDRSSILTRLKRR
jgi:O-antigen/teichoic acid export membrane protein